MGMGLCPGSPCGDEGEGGCPRRTRRNAGLTNAPISRGMPRRSAPSDCRPSPTMNAPRRIAKILKAVVSMLNAIDAAMLCASRGVPAARCTMYSAVCPIAGNRTMAVSIACRFERAAASACVTLPSAPDITVRKANSVSIARTPAPAPAGRLASRKIGARTSELNAADFQFHCTTR